MGRVYLAEHVKMGRKSAVKVLSHDLKFSADAISRFHREAANASRISHPNVAAIYDFGETAEGTLYLAMEFVEGETLRGLLAREPRLDVMRSARLIKQAADALAAAHHLGIIHRDLKPDNIMVARGLDGSDLVKVVDFGIAKTMDERSGSQTLTTAGVSIGTPEYMSPEQLAGEKLDARTDVYSLALVLFHLLTGTLPYPRLTSRETLVRRLTSPARKLSDVAPDIDWPVELQRAMDRALAPYVEDRYSSVGDFGREVVAAAESMHHGRTVRMQSVDRSGSHATTQKVDSSEGPTLASGGNHTRSFVGTMIVLLATATLLFRAEPIGRESHPAQRATAPSPARADSQPTAANHLQDSTAPSPSQQAAIPASLTTDSTVLQAGNVAKPAERDSSLKHVATDSTKPVVHDSVRSGTHDTTKVAARDTTRSVARDSVKTKRDSTRAVLKRDSATAPRNDAKPAATSAVTHTEAKPSPTLPAPQADLAAAQPFDSVGAVRRPHRLLRSTGDTAGAVAPATLDDSTRAAAEDIRGHFEKARLLLSEGKPAEAQLEFRDAAVELRALRSRLDPNATRDLDLALRRLRQQSYDACVNARDRAADSAAAGRFQCERIVTRPGALARQTKPTTP